MSGKDDEVGNERCEGTSLPSFNDAIEYVAAVKERFENDPQNYERFLEVMKDFREKELDVNGVITRVKEIFENHVDLLYAFKIFLPEGYEITIDDSRHNNDSQEQREGGVWSKKEEGFKSDFTSAQDLILEVKKRFSTQPTKYERFLRVLEGKDREEIITEIEGLLKNHEDLILAFNEFV